MMIKKFALILCLLLCFVNISYATDRKVTPLEKITTANKYFQVGDTVYFKDINTNEILSGIVTYYRPNGTSGQEAQIEINNFKNEKGNDVLGKITIIPTNHKNFQEFANYFSFGMMDFVRGSEISLLPDKHIFTLSDKENLCRIISVSIKPKNNISTVYDEVEIDDWIEFVITKDIYKKNKLFIKKDTPIYAQVEYFTENGWGCDNATIDFKKFVTKDVNNNRIEFNSQLSINGFELMKYKRNNLAKLISYFGFIVRGKEIDLRLKEKPVQFNVLTKAL